MRKIFLLLLLLTSSVFSQQIIGRKPLLGTQINWSHSHPKGLMALWLFYEGSGGKVYDLSPHNYDAILAGDMVPLDDWVIGRDGWALDFDGSNDFLTVTNPNINFDEVTVVAWIATDAPTTKSEIINLGNGIVILRPWDGPNIAFFVNANNSITAHESVALTAGEWAHLVGTYDGSNVRIYVNGVEGDNSPAANTGTIDAIGETNWHIGIFANETANPFNGRISVLSLYDRAWTSQEVLKDFIYSYAIFEQPPGRILAAAVAEAVRKRLSITF